jgi:hypothetical protein
MNLVIQLTQGTATRRHSVRTCVHNSHTLDVLFSYKNSSCLRSRYMDYKPESFKNVLSRQSFSCSKRLASLTPARNLSITGQIFDDKSKPLAGIKVSIGRTAMVSTTDEQGQFELNNIPPGRIDLFIDGRTYNPSFDPARAQYPSLHFEAYAVKGRINQIAHPIYLPPLATSTDSAKQVGGNQDVILTISGLAGFQMKIKANSVTFPDGSKTGLLIVSPVTADKLPMSPPAGGATFGVPAWTIQPAGTRFDPPIEVTLPNAGGYPAGDNLPIVQWDHDLGQYVAMGRATVSEDGAVLITDSGSGLTKAGWGGLCQYDPDKCGSKEPPKCGDCEQLLTGRSDCPTCYPDPAKNNSICDRKICNTCQNGTCKADPTKDGLRDTGIDVNIINVSLETPSYKFFKHSLTKWVTKYGGLEIGVKGKVSGTLRESHICCSKNEGAISSNLNIGGDVELEFSWNWLKGSRLVTEFTGINTLGAFTKVKLFVGTGGATSELIWEDCERKGSGLLAVGGGITVEALNATIKGKIPVNGGEVSVEYTPVLFGGGGGLSTTAKLTSSKAIKELGTWRWNVFLKVMEYKFGLFKIALANVSYSDNGTVDGVSFLGGL